MLKRKIRHTKDFTYKEAKMSPEVMKDSGATGFSTHEKKFKLTKG